MKDPSGCCTPARREGSERHKETGGIVTVNVASLPGNLLVMLISAYKPFITADEQLIRLPAPWPAALMHSECLSITRRHERCPQGRLTVHHRFFVAVHFFTLASFNGNLEARYGTISSLYAIRHQRMEMKRCYESCLLDEAEWFSYRIGSCESFKWLSFFFSFFFRLEKHYFVERNMGCYCIIVRWR